MSAITVMSVSSASIWLSRAKSRARGHPSSAGRGARARRTAAIASGIGVRATSSLRSISPRMKSSSRTSQ